MEKWSRKGLAMGHTKEAPKATPPAKADPVPKAKNGLGILQFIGAHKKTDGLPTRMSVTAPDRYLLDLLIRFLQGLSKRDTRVVAWTKARDPVLRAELEEVSLVGIKPFHVITGAPAGWVRSIEPAANTYILSQEPDGTLQGEAFHWRGRPLILRALVGLLGLQWGVQDLSRVDWSWARSWADFEPLLARGRLMDWDQNRLMREAASRTRGHVLGLINDGRWRDLEFLGARYSRAWLYRHIQETILDVIRLHDYKAAGYKQDQVRRLLGEPPDWIYDQLRDAAGDFDKEALVGLATRIVALDAHVKRDINRGLDLVLMGADLKRSRRVQK